MDITGTWYNELGSTMEIAISLGTVEGSYTTAVSSSACAQGSFNLLGTTDTDTGGQAVAFSVCWKNATSQQCNSVTAWSGQAQTINGIDQINAFWLLTVETSPDQDWFATHVGQDVFTRTPPTDEQTASKSKMRRSHP
jgi:hypothetical protein